MVATDLSGHDHGQLHQRDEALVPPVPFGQGIERLAGVPVLRRHPRLDLGGVARLQPAVGVGHLGAVEDVDDVVAPCRRRRAHRVGLDQPRPMLGRLPWLALERRSRALRFFVFLDIAIRVYGWTDRSHGAQAGSASSMAPTSSGADGATIGLNLVIEPSGATRNFSKFHRMSPS